ncbi:MAG: hypothetical protein EBT63_05680 [Proteobacteria bacterium]|nr:hypothetical protein [Pseudomonadota bacterium]NCA28577.1 hypothetical protein [Pseudomonadota bacterium]
MKLYIYLLSLLILINSNSFAKEIDLKDKIKNINIETDKTDNREPIQQIDFKKLFSDAENYFNKAKAWKRLKCEPKSGFICTKHECKKRAISSLLILDKDKKIIKRCEADGMCESFKAQFEQTGVYFNVQTSGPVGTLVRVLGDSRFKEIASVGLDAYIANGNCEVIGEEEFADNESDIIN